MHSIILCALACRVTLWSFNLNSFPHIFICWWWQTDRWNGRWTVARCILVLISCPRAVTSDDFLPSGRRLVARICRWIFRRGRSCHARPFDPCRCLCVCGSVAFPGTGPPDLMVQWSGEVPGQFLNTTRSRRGFGQKNSHKKLLGDELVTTTTGKFFICISIFFTNLQKKIYLSQSFTSCMKRRYPHNRRF
jgi:hypothetical protein